MADPHGNGNTVVPCPPTRSHGARASYDAIVIGSGVGGSVTGALLGRGGARVLMLEKNRALGGILASYRDHGFKIDVGSHLVASGAKGPLGRVLRELGLVRPRFLTHRVPLRSRGMFDMAAPTTRRGLLAAARQAAHTLELSSSEQAHLARMLFQVFTLTEFELRRWDRRTLDDFILGHTTHPGAYFLFSFMASIFFVLPPWQVSAGEAIRALRGLLSAYALSYVEGGMDSVIHALLGFVVAAGGDIAPGQQVVGIRPVAAGTGALEVTCADGRDYRAPVVVCNMAAGDALALLDGVHVPDAYAARVAGIRPSGNAHQLKLGLRRKLVEEGCLIGGVSLSGLTLADLSVDLMHRTVACIDSGRVSDPLAVYAPVPSNYDATLAPPGAQLIVASIYGPIRDDPEDAPERWRKRAMAALASVIPGLEDELLFAEFTSIPEVGLWMGKRCRGAISNGQWPGQVGRDRLPVTTPVPGLYVCGDSAGGRGIGTELATMSALEVIRALQSERAHGRLGSGAGPGIESGIKDSRRAA